MTNPNARKHEAAEVIPSSSYPFEGFYRRPALPRRLPRQLLPSPAPSYSTARALFKPSTVGGPPRGTKHQEGLVIPSSPPLGHGVSRYDIRVVQSPSDCILRSVSPLCRLRSDVSGPPSLTPCVSVVARQTPPRPCLCQWVRMAEGRRFHHVKSDI